MDAYDSVRCDWLAGAVTPELADKLHEAAELAMASGAVAPGRGPDGLGAAAAPGPGVAASRRRFAGPLGGVDRLTGGVTHFGTLFISQGVSLAGPTCDRRQKP